MDNIPKEDPGAIINIHYYQTAYSPVATSFSLG